ncbi:MAG TPA: acetyl-CoA carboxylase biotin carboxylase subunit [Elusimicrobia bacterium]|nr:MAG: acetyl-CoA carboxylase biotin carboxylase subunit [Elusimicrobia bacterium RIFOXYA12_FULL_49_49]OGS10943.1 MAG: acetyl-CoA carboxylase biotin carboxylase subunit [Elusimicrobia bacterium RIFOXYB1_FULL_48_9]OGS16622.1 MAG: acetyl-CoA carboxylase biotin carboxylase subunit [Elusimicrobia bacterium RIFOXYA2_FULL_47_53]OGS25471.1 MAG: acetyl-CoA carboxylase biotin carboxylase subunit [Elusimicrobia bacterium RIFOXYB12_FULL_50_12]OGS31600.1 MAG: acetyl-CoA carboxylase biotin carboxylase subu
MFKKILVANRGEIACRVIKACKELGVKVVAIHSEIDKDCAHVRLADESICVGPGPASESYLNIPSIISAAEISGADAIHPGYGFLAENTYFAEVCESCGIKFIGPSKEAIDKMGDKIAARELMMKAGVPVVPGSDGPVSIDDPNIFKLAKKIGYPLIVKASAGGGGKGMRVVATEEALENAIAMAQTEAKAAFGDESVYIEKYIEEPRHIEFQILGDSKGKVVYLPERDCSIQRRHQKLVEESPSPFISAHLRRKMGRAARHAAEAVKYVTVGTVEFLVDKSGHYYFMEMNTRIQVEHPVTEVITGIDLVKEQIRLAAGERLTFDSGDVKILGHAIECRINAEDPDRDFIPSPGKVTQFIPPGGPGIRVETHVYPGYTIPSFYDSLIGKIIAMGSNRAEAIARMLRALDEMVIEGIKTTAPLHKKIMQHDYYHKGDVYTDFLPKHIFRGR